MEPDTVTYRTLELREPPVTPPTPQAGLPKRKHLALVPTWLCRTVATVLPAIGTFTGWLIWQFILLQTQFTVLKQEFDQRQADFSNQSAAVIRASADCTALGKRLDFVEQLILKQTKATNDGHE